MRGQESVAISGVPAILFKCDLLALKQGPLCLDGTVTSSVTLVMVRAPDISVLSTYIWNFKNDHPYLMVANILEGSFYKTNF